MGKKSRKKRLKRENKSNKTEYPIFTQMAEGGLHTLMPGKPPSKKKLEEMTKKYQQEIRNSPLWDQMLIEFGKEKAEELLKEFRVETRP